MTTPNKPKIPEGLLERCLTTIPESATYRPSLSPDSASRTRLRWLSVAAAVPIVMVIAVMPIRYWVAAQVLSRQIATRSNFVAAEAKKKDYLYVKSWRVGLDVDFRTLSLSPADVPKRYSVTIVQRGKGIYSAHVESDYETLAEAPDTTSKTDIGTVVADKKNRLIDRWDKPTYGSLLQLAEGRYYLWDGRRNSKAIFRKNMIDYVSKQYNIFVETTIMGGAFPSRTTQRLGKPKVYSGFWKSKTVSIVEYSLNDSRKPAKNDLMFQHRIQFFVSPTDNLVLGKRRYMRAVGSSKEILISESEYSYTPSEEKLQHLNPESFPFPK